MHCDWIRWEKLISIGSVDLILRWELAGSWLLVILTDVLIFLIDERKRQINLDFVELHDSNQYRKMTSEPGMCVQKPEAFCTHVAEAQI